MSVMRLLVTGAGGQLGHALTRAPLPAGWQATTLARSALDVADRKAVIEALETLRPAAVINAAAYTAVDAAEADAPRAFAVNGEGPGHLAEGCARSGAVLVHVSTDYVFDGRAGRPWREDDPVAPLGVYGASKAAGEAAVRQRLERHAILRTSWLFGAGGENFVTRILRAGQTRPVLAVVAGQTGGPTPTEALAEALVAIAVRLAGRAEGAGTYHYCGHPPTSWFGWAERIFAEAARCGARVPELRSTTAAAFAAPAPRPANSILDCGKIAATFGIPQPEWQQASNRLVEHCVAAPS